jgi:hypothetical protein
MSRQTIEVFFSEITRHQLLFQLADKQNSPAGDECLIQIVRNKISRKKITKCNLIKRIYSFISSKCHRTKRGNNVNDRRKKKSIVKASFWLRSERQVSTQAIREFVAWKQSWQTRARNFKLMYIVRISRTIKSRYWQHFIN